jgi:hypothetical protein
MHWLMRNMAGFKRNCPTCLKHLYRNTSDFTLYSDRQCRHLRYIQRSSYSGSSYRWQCKPNNDPFSHYANHLICRFVRSDLYRRLLDHSLSRIYPNAERLAIKRNHFVYLHQPLCKYNYRDRFLFINKSYLQEYQRQCNNNYTRRCHTAGRQRSFIMRKFLVRN